MCLDRAQCRRNLKKSALSWKTAYINSSINVQTLGLVLIVKKKKNRAREARPHFKFFEITGKMFTSAVGKTFDYSLCFPYSANSG